MEAGKPFHGNGMKSPHHTVTHLRHSPAPVRGGEAQPMLPVPEKLMESVAFDRSKKCIYVARNCAGDPLLLTWQDRNRAAGHNITIKPCDVDVISKMRQEGMRPDDADVDADLVNKQLALDMIAKAAEYQASDIHLMVRTDYVEVQLEIKGALRVLQRMSKQEGQAVIMAIYQGIAGSRDAGFMAHEFQNAQIAGSDLPPGSPLTSARIVRGPSYPHHLDGAFMTIRLQYSASKAKGSQANLDALELPRRPEGEFALGEMGYTASQMDKLKALMDAPNGMILFLGPTGSGKTTALYECMMHEARVRPHRRQVTIEDPVEYPMIWGVQLLVTNVRTDKATGEAYAERVRVALRMAPKTLLVGEIRGPEVAVAALEGALTGHKVLSTMHVTDPFLFVERLELMDRVRLDRRVFCDHKIVRGVIAQRLLPKLCPKCSKPLAEFPEALPTRILEALKTWGDISKVRVKGAGCDHCNHDGTNGRFAVAEVVVMDAAIMADFISHGSDTARSNYRARPDADPSMLEAAINRALDGEVDPCSVEDFVDLIEPKEMA